MCVARKAGVERDRGERRVSAAKQLPRMLQSPRLDVLMWRRRKTRLERTGKSNHAHAKCGGHVHRRRRILQVGIDKHLEPFRH